MSLARSTYIKEVHALSAAVSSPDVGTDSDPLGNPGASVLRRGATIAGLVMLETFLRDRTEEILTELQNWPARYKDLPDRFRDRATIEALPHIVKYARLLKRQKNDYETEILKQVGKIASMSPPVFKFTKFVAGDYTGNLSEEGTKDLLRVFQVKNCWESMKLLGSDIGLGVPSLKEIHNSIIRNRHLSAHSASHHPPAGDVIDLPKNLTLIGICLDTALSVSVSVALTNWKTWVSNDFVWRKFLDIYFVSPSGSKLKLQKKDAKRATRVVNKYAEILAAFPTRPLNKTRLLVKHDQDLQPTAWNIV